MLLHEAPFFRLPDKTFFFLLLSLFFFLQHRYGKVVNEKSAQYNAMHI